MSNYFIITRKGGARTFLAIIACLFLFANSILAQNTSYNANTVPIYGLHNTAFGFGALISNSTGQSNAASGKQALGSNTTGDYNTANGAQALVINTTGNYNTANGAQALYFNTGYQNTASGFQALYYNTPGNYNTAHGAQALYNNYSGNYNTANGNFALGYNYLGSNNTALGDSAGFNSQGSSNVFIGNKAGANESTGSNKMYIGNAAAKTLLYGDFSSGQVLLGKPNATGYVFKGTRTLNVLGGILTDSMRLALSGDWADKVFNKDYPLKPLQELEQYISANKHLPGIPSANEVKANDVNVGDMDSKLLEKIEELHLYILQQQKEIELQQKNYELQQKQINELKRQIKYSN